MPAISEVGASRDEARVVAPAPWRWPVVAVVGAVAFLARLVVVLGSGGLLGQVGNDPGVYFTAASALTFGQLPYRDFYLVHPPVVPLVLTPFALLARLTSDPIGFAVANVFAMVVGALNAMLVVRLGWRLLDDFRAAVAGGLFYAAWLGAVTAEFSARLEPFGTFFFLGGLLLLHRSRGAAPWRCGLGAGALLALATLTKLWWVVPVLVVLGWPSSRGGRARGTVAVTIGGLVAAVLVLAPFWLAAGRALWTMVVVAQLGRPASAVPVATRMVDLAVGPGPAGAGWRSTAAIALAGCLLACLGLCWTRPVLRRLVVVLVAQLGVLCLSPSWFGYYTGYVAAPLALVVAGACAVGCGSGPTRARAASVVRVVPALLALAFTVGHLGRVDDVAPIQARSDIAAALAPYGCTTSELPTVLVQVDAMTRGMAHGCPNWVDVTAPRLVEPELAGAGQWHRVALDAGRLPRQRRRGPGDRPARRADPRRPRGAGGGPGRRPARHDGGLPPALIPARGPASQASSSANHRPLALTVRTWVS